MDFAINKKTVTVPDRQLLRTDLSPGTIAFPVREHEQDRVLWF